ncbi:MAG: transaldolase [Solirubrobacterales bacterium]|nr:transaldolase [Solirubrobacterales bacterium]
MDHPQAGLSTAPRSAADLHVKIFADGADLEGIRRLYADPQIAGFTTNPTLMRKAGISDYESFAKELLQHVPDRPISFEVFSDDAPEMRRQALKIAGWGENVYVKIPVTNTKGESMASLVKDLSTAGVKVNVTALFTPRQVEEITDAVKDGAASNISVFAGRIADAGVDPLPIMTESLKIMSAAPKSELIWASPREILNIVQADQTGTHIITVTHDLLAKLKSIGKDLDQFSLDTVKMFHNDATSAGFKL